MKKLRKSLTIILCMTLFMGTLAGYSVCAFAEDTSTASESTETVSSDEETLVFEYFNLTMAVEWIQQIYDALEELGEEYNFTVLNADANYDIEQQMTQVDTALLQGIDGAFLFIVDEGSASAVVEKFDDAGVPVIGETLTLKNEDGVNIAPYVELDAEAVGAECAYWVAENWESCDVDMSDMSKVGVILNTNSKFTSDLNRSAGFESALKESLPDIPEENYITADNGSTGTDDDSENSYNLVSAQLSAHPEIETWIVIGTVDNYALGACRAIEAAGLEDSTILVSCGGESAVKEWANDSAECWRAACYYSAMDFAEVMVEGMLQICREGYSASEIYDDYRIDDEEYAAVGISGTMITSENYTDYVE